MGRINRLEKTASQLAGELTQVLLDLEEVKQVLSTDQSPFGTVYPQSNEI
ncbi:MAG: hypothetical protein IKO35_05765 [Elusimicrobiaceae bacterium]|nr:hypothetical protein [Elusimicrobiaceae bacterium]